METSLLGQEEEGRAYEILDLTGKTVTSTSGAIAAGHGALGSNLSTTPPSPACHFCIAQGFTLKPQPPRACQHRELNVGNWLLNCSGAELGLYQLEAIVTTARPGQERTTVDDPEPTI